MYSKKFPRSQRQPIQREKTLARIDAVNNINDIMNLYQQMQSNPMALLSRRFSIPQGMNDPNQIIQHLLSTNQVSQAQVNSAMNMRNNPIIRQLMRK